MASTKFPWIERYKDGAISLKTRLPINAHTRQFVNSEIESFRHSVIPICGEDTHRRPCLLGSGVLVSYSGATVLLTAAHVLLDNIGIPLFVFGADGLGKFLDLDFSLDEDADLGAMRLSAKDLAVLSHTRPLPEQMIATTGFNGGRFYGSVVGYPASSSKRPEKNALHTSMEVYSNFGTELIGDRVSISFDWKDGAFSDADGHVKARKPTGKSGGAIFGFPATINSVLPRVRPKLVGIASRWKRQESRIEGPGPSSIGRILKTVT